MTHVLGLPLGSVAVTVTLCGPMPNGALPKSGDCTSVTLPDRSLAVTCAVGPVSTFGTALVKTPSTPESDRLIGAPHDSSGFVVSDTMTLSDFVAVQPAPSVIVKLCTVVFGPGDATVGPGNVVPTAGALMLTTPEPLTVAEICGSLEIRPGLASQAAKGLLEITAPRPGAVSSSVTDAGNDALNVGACVSMLTACPMLN